MKDNAGCLQPAVRATVARRGLCANIVSHRANYVRPASALVTAWLLQVDVLLCLALIACVGSVVNAFGA